MSMPTPVSGRRLLVAALLSALAVTGAFSSVYTGVLLLGPAEVVLPLGGGAGAVAAMVLGTWLTEVLWYVPFLLVVLRFVAEPSRENAVSGAIIIYAVGLLFAWLPTQTMGAETTMATTVLPLGNVATYLTVVTVVWLAHGGRPERRRVHGRRPPAGPVPRRGGVASGGPAGHRPATRPAVGPEGGGSRRRRAGGGGAPVGAGRPRPPAPGAGRPVASTAGRREHARRYRRRRMARVSRRTRTAPELVGPKPNATAGLLPHSVASPQSGPGRGRSHEM